MKFSLTRLLPTAAACLVFSGGGCTTFSHQAVDSEVVRCREHCQAGLSAARRGREENAHQMFAAAVEACPVDERARRLYAESLWDQGRADSAVEQMEQAVRLSGGEAETMVRLGQMYLARDNIDGAATQAARAIAASPQLAKAWALEGDVLARREQYDVALARYHRALAYRSDYPQVQFAVAEIYARQGRHTRALATLAALAQQYNPDNSPQRLHVMRGRSYRALRRYDEAASEFSLAAKAAPPTPDLLYELAETLASSGETTAARMTAEQALTLQPRHANARQLLARLDRGLPGGVRRY